MRDLGRTRSGFIDNLSDRSCGQTPRWTISNEWGESELGGATDSLSSNRSSPSVLGASQGGPAFHDITSPIKCFPRLSPFLASLHTPTGTQTGCAYGNFWSTHMLRQPWSPMVCVRGELRIP